MRYREILRKSAVPELGDPGSLAGILTRLGLTALALVILFEAVLHASSHKLALLAVVAAAPFSIPLVVPALIGLGPAFFRFARDHRLAGWQGRYYEFERRHIRIETLDDRVWIVWVDAARAGGLQDAISPLALPAQERSLLPRSGAIGVSDQFLLKLLAGRRSTQAACFERWLLQEVLPPLYRRLGRVPELELRSDAGPQHGSHA